MGEMKTLEARERERERERERKFREGPRTRLRARGSTGAWFTQLVHYLFFNYFPLAGERERMGRECVDM